MLTELKSVPFKPQKPLMVTWDTWRKGLNILLRETEIDKTAVVSATNLLLVGSGVPTKRWGSQTYYQSGATGANRFIGQFKDANDNAQFLAVTDGGYLTKQSGASYTTITGVSWASGYNIEATELGGKIYFVSPVRELARYDFTTLTGFATLSTPVLTSVTNLSGVTGTTTWSWRVSATSAVGETIASTPLSLSSLPQNLGTEVLLKWSAVSAASGTLTGYNVYRGWLGQETWVGGVDANTTQFVDGGQADQDPTRIAPLVNSTGGPKAKYIIRFQDRLILAGIPGDPTKVLISGRFPYQDRFDWLANGGFIMIEPDSGEDITGIGVYYRTQTSEQTIVVFKENSVWEVALANASVDGYAVLTPTYRLLTQSQGCSSHRSIVPVENDVMFANRRGIFILRYKQNSYNIIDANEISLDIRPFFEGLAYSDLSQAAGFYADYKYVLSFPTSKQSIVFDRQRLSFMGPWTTPFNINKWTMSTDSATGTQHWLAADAASPEVYEFSKSYQDDSGIAIPTSFKTRKEDFGDWTLYKTLNEVYMNFRSITGNIQVNIYIEDRTGKVVSAKSFTIIGNSSLGTSGFGINQFGMTEMGLTQDKSIVFAGELQRKALMYKTARTMQIEIVTTSIAANYELLNIKAIAIGQARGNNPTSWNS